MTSHLKSVPNPGVVEPPVAERERLKKLQAALEVLTPRGGPSEQAVKTALYDGTPEVIANIILKHTEEGVEGERMLETILALETSGRLARFLAAELKKRANDLGLKRNDTLPAP